MEGRETKSSGIAIRCVAEQGFRVGWSVLRGSRCQESSFPSAWVSRTFQSGGVPGGRQGLGIGVAMQAIHTVAPDGGEHAFFY